MVIDDFLPRWDARSQHEAVVQATPERVYGELRSVDIGRSPVIRMLFALRGLPREWRTFEGIERRAFTVLVEQPPTALVLGIVGRFWTPRGDLQRVAPEDWVPFDEPGFAKAAWGFSLEALPEGGCRLATETRVWCTDPASRRRFLRYWRIVGPFSGWIRQEILRLVRRQSEAAPA